MEEGEGKKGEKEERKEREREERKEEGVLDQRRNFWSLKIRPPQSKEEGRKRPKAGLRESRTY